MKTVIVKKEEKPKEKPFQISVTVPLEVGKKIQSRADKLYQGKLAMAARELLCNATKDLP
jgi:hypothetical protein